MKWTSNKRQRRLKYLFNSGYEEEVTRFLWWPVQIDGQWRWLERARVKRMVWRKSTTLRTVYYWVYYEWI